MKQNVMDAGVLMWGRPEEAIASATTAHNGLLNKSEERDHGALGALAILGLLSLKKEYVGLA